MNALPKSADLVSFVVVTIFMCAITYVLVLNIRHLKDAISQGRSSMRSMLHTRKNKDPEQRVESYGVISSPAKRASTMA